MAGTRTRVAALARRFFGAVLMVVASAELTSFFVYRVWARRWFSYSEVAAERREAAGQSVSR